MNLRGTIRQCTWDDVRIPSRLKRTTPIRSGDRLNGSQPVFGIIDDAGLFNMAIETKDL